MIIIILITSIVIKSGFTVTKQKQVYKSKMVRKIFTVLNCMKKLKSQVAKRCCDFKLLEMKALKYMKG